MYFFRDPDDLLSVLDLRVQSLVFGPKVTNEAMYKAYQSLINSDKTLGTNSESGYFFWTKPAHDKDSTLIGDIAHCPITPQRRRCHTR